MNWEQIEGWFDFHRLYDEQVRRAKGKVRFVEIGAWLGKSTAYMGQAIKESGKDIEFHVIDTWDNTNVRPENGTAEGGAYAHRYNGKTKELFTSNMAQCGLSDLLNVHEMDSTQAASLFEDESVDFVFIDGDHTEQKVFADCYAWWPKIKPGGVLAGHDYNEPCVKNAVTRFGETVKKAVYGDGMYLNDYKCFSIPKPSKNDYGIFLGIPHYDGTVIAASIVTACTQAYTGEGFVGLKEHAASALCSNFNYLWAVALNMPNITHFAMLHADIFPMAYWLDVLMREMEQENAHMVSTVMAIKDRFGLSSTGIVFDDNHWTPKRRFTMHELMHMPSTFDAELAGYPGGQLVLNTGCWLADLRDDRWRKENPDGSLYFHFQMNDMIKKVGGIYRNFFEPEDFYFSRLVQEEGMRAVATRKPQCNHIGTAGYKNEGLWGDWKCDERTKDIWMPELKQQAVLK